jgi:hypothetical protein
MKNKSDLKLDKISIIILIISGLLIGFSFVAPMIFVKESNFGFDFSDKGQIGDTIGGIMNPFVALSGVFLTFLAFYIQFKANQLQRNLFRQELDSNKFENQFYEMLRLHKENVNEISITLKSSYYSGKETVKNERPINGREAFKYLLYELTILYYTAKDKYVDKEISFLLNKAYSVFFHGLDYFKRKQNIDSIDKSFISELEDIQKATNSTQFNNIVHKHRLDLDWYKFDIFEGHSTHLAHYYRHLFQTVKYVANQPDNFIDYPEKRKYLRILRAQLANQEQAMLFYNWRAGFGSTWENEINKYFTDYRMIHNLYNDILIQDFDLVEIFDLNNNTNYKKEPNRLDDKLFEFEDWY